MKIRTGFVSNSSSSSFIVYGQSKWNENAERNLKAYIHRFIDGHVFRYNPQEDFGWNFRVYYDWMSKFDWAFLQMYYHLYEPEHTYYYETMLEFLRLYYPEIERIETKRFQLEQYPDFEDEDYYVEDEPSGYIDHESIGGENAEILEDVDTLRNFILCDDSFICNQNDNSDWYWKIVDGVPTKTQYNGMWD